MKAASRAVVQALLEIDVVLQVDRAAALRIAEPVRKEAARRIDGPRRKVREQALRILAVRVGFVADVGAKAPRVRLDGRPQHFDGEPPHPEHAGGLRDRERLREFDRVVSGSVEIERRLGRDAPKAILRAALERVVAADASYKDHAGQHRRRRQHAEQDRAAEQAVGEADRGGLAHRTGVIARMLAATAMRSRRAGRSYPRSQRADDRSIGPSRPCVRAT